MGPGRSVGLWVCRSLKPSRTGSLFPFLLAPCVVEIIIRSYICFVAATARYCCSGCRDFCTRRYNSSSSSTTIVLLVWRLKIQACIKHVRRCRCARNPFIFSPIRRQSQLKATVVLSPGLSVWTRADRLQHHDGGLKPFYLLFSLFLRYSSAPVIGACLVTTDWAAAMSSYEQRYEQQRFSLQSIRVCVVRTTATTQFYRRRAIQTCVTHQARRDITEREEMLQRERHSAVAKVQRESGLEKEKLDKEVARLREDKLKLDGLNREMNDRGSLVRRPMWQ